MTHATRKERHAPVNPEPELAVADVPTPTTVELSVPMESIPLIRAVSTRLTVDAESLLSLCIQIGVGRARAEGFARKGRTPEPEGGYSGTLAVSSDWYDHHAPLASEVGCSAGVLATTVLRDLSGWFLRSPRVRLRGRSQIERGIARG